MSMSWPDEGCGGKPRAARRVAVCALLLALALVLSYIEALIPSAGIPGVKFGLANIVIIVALYRLGAGYAYGINIARILLAGLMFNGFSAIFYSLAGGLAGLSVMCLLKKTGIFSVTGVSMAAGVAHNFAQVLAAALVIENIRLFAYFPVLIFSGTAAGIVTGILAALILKKLPG